MTETIIEKILTKVKSASAHEIQFRLGHKTIAKSSGDWIEIDQESLGLSEWEDLKEICLQNSEKLVLETKGFVRGLFKTNDSVWSFSFSEHKDCLKAFFNVMPEFQLSPYLQSPLFWESLKANSGLFIISGERGQGKSSLLKDILNEIKKDSPRMVALHGHHSPLSLINNDAILHLSEETVTWDYSHPIYDGIEHFVVDYNQIKNWEKWIKMCEEGRTVFVTVSGLSVENCMDQIITQLNPTAHQGDYTGLVKRFFNCLNGICYQKVMGQKEGAIHEFLIIPQNFKAEIIKIGFQQFIKEKLSLDSYKKYYQSLNQSIIQALVRRRIDVKSAFSATSAPEELDLILKQMGL